MDQNKYISTHEIARLLQMDPSTITKWIDKGLITGFKTPGGHRRVRVGSVVDFCKAHNFPIPNEINPQPEPQSQPKGAKKRGN